MVSIVVPVYNEQATIEELLHRADALPFEHEIVVVDDGSTDGTPGILKRLAPRLNLRRHRLPVNLGKGAALRVGFSLARGEVIAVLDADLELDPEDLSAVVAALEHEQADAAYGSRFLRGRGDVPRGSYWANRALTTFTNLLFGAHLSDQATGFKVFRRKLLQDLGLRCVGFEFCAEITAKLLRRRAHIVEVPVAYRPRRAGKKLRPLRDGVRAAWTLLRWRFLPLPPHLPTAAGRAEVEP